MPLPDETLMIFQAGAEQVGHGARVNRVRVV
jgi:hypothetical protein